MATKGQHSRRFSRYEYFRNQEGSGIPVENSVPVAEFGLRSSLQVHTVSGVANTVPACKLTRVLYFQSTRWLETDGLACLVNANQGFD